jgi:hypothetical protein
MAYGLQVFDSSGNLEVDISSRLSRFVSIYYFNSAIDQTININVPNIVDDGTWMVSQIGEAGSVQIFTGYVQIKTSHFYNTSVDFFMVFRL